MKLSPLIAVLALSTLVLTGCDEIDDMAGVGGKKGVYTGAKDTPLSEEAVKALGKRAASQKFGL
jgi:uncharacterized lipoprotein NlpE involved in copper resistance